MTDFMGYDALLRPGQETGDRRAEGAPVRGGVRVCSRGLAGYGGRGVWGQPPDGRAAGPPAPAGPSAVVARRHGLAPSAARPRVQYGPVDPAPRGRGDRAPHRGALSLQVRLEPASSKFTPPVRCDGGLAEPVRPATACIPTHCGR